MTLSKKDKSLFRSRRTKVLNRTIRLAVLRKRLIKKRRLEKQFAARRALSGLALWLVTLAVAAMLIIAGFYVNAILSDLPGINRLEELAGPNGSLYQPTLYYDRNGSVLIPGSNLVDTQVDYRPYATDSGNEGSSLLARYVTGLLEMVNQGDASLDILHSNNNPKITLAERLVSDLLMPDISPSFVNRIRFELLTAQANVRYGQNNLLEWYLNSVPCGHNIRGAGSASLAYFKKPVEQLNPGETLLLAVIAIEPANNPIDTPEAYAASFKAAGSYLLNQGLVDTGVLQQANEALSTIKMGGGMEVVTLPAFYTLAREQLSQTPGINDPERGGLRVITSMDLDIQNRLECGLLAIYAGVPRGMACDPSLSGLSGQLIENSLPDDVVVNFVVVEPSTGQILAMLGDYSPVTGEQDFLHPHPSGSLVTPFIYLNGMLQGLTPATLVWDTPTGLDEIPWEHHPPADGYQGPMSVRTALSGEHLTPTIKLLARYGMDNVVDLMEGFGTHLYASEGIPYTSGVVDALSIAQSFSIFANDGIKAGVSDEGSFKNLMQTAILRALDRNQALVLDRTTILKQAVINPELTFLTNDMLIPTRPVTPSFRGATKVGTTSDGANYWRVAYTTDYVFVLWMGYSDPDGKPLLSELGVDTVLIHLLDEYFEPKAQFTGWQVPEGVTRLKVCTPSGLLPGEDCPQIVNEYFMAGTEPTEKDSLYMRFPIDAETGRLATVFTDPANVIQQVFFNPPPEELAWAANAGFPLSPSEYTVYQPGETVGSTVIVKPLNFTNVRGNLTISGKMDAAGFISYRLDLGNGLAPSQWLQIGDTIASLPNDNSLGTLDTTRYSNGLYTLRIQVLRSGNTVDNSYVVILIDNPLVTD